MTRGDWGREGEEVGGWEGMGGEKGGGWWRLMIHVPGGIFAARISGMEGLIIQCNVFQKPGCELVDSRDSKLRTHG